MKLKHPSIYALLLLSLGLGIISTCKAQSFYSCIDKYGRKLGSDRPIPECANTIQKEHNSAGVVIRQRDGAANNSSSETASIASKANKNETTLDERKEKALLTRYRNPELHNQERQRVLAIVDINIARTQKQINELLVVKVNLEKEVNKPADQQTQTVAAIKRKITNNEQTLKILKAMLTDSNLERQRANQRFDDEQTILLKLWDSPVKN